MCNMDRCDFYEQEFIVNWGDTTVSAGRVPAESESDG